MTQDKLVKVYNYLQVANKGLSVAANAIILVVGGVGFGWCAKEIRKEMRAARKESEKA